MVKKYIMDNQIGLKKSWLKEIVIIGLILILISLVFLIYLNYHFSKKISQLELEFQKTAISKKETKEPPKVSLPKVLYNLTGKIKNLERNTIVFEANVPVIDENNQPRSKIEIRKAIITPNTKFTRLTFVQKESDNKKIPLETNITLNDLKISDYIDVISNQDIYQKEEFESTEIRVLPQ